MRFPAALFLAVPVPPELGTFAVVIAALITVAAALFLAVPVFATGYYPTQQFDTPWYSFTNDGGVILQQSVSAAWGYTADLTQSWTLSLFGSGPGYIAAHFSRDSDTGAYFPGSTHSAGASVAGIELAGNGSDFHIPVTLGTHFDVGLHTLAKTIEGTDQFGEPNWVYQLAYLQLRAFNSSGAQVAITHAPEPGTFAVVIAALITVLAGRSKLVSWPQSLR